MDLTLYQFRHRKKKKRFSGRGGVTFKDDDCEGLHSFTLVFPYLSSW